MENQFIYTARIEVRYAETDAMGIVHHATYLFITLPLGRR